MIPISIKKPDFITVVIDKNSILCAAVRPSTYKPYTLHHVASTTHPCIAQTGSLLHTTLIGNQIAAFIRKYKLERSFTTIVCADPLIQEGFATTTTASAQSYLHHNLTLPHTQLHSLYLGPYQDRFLHWWHRMSYPLMLQFQLLAYKYKLNIVRIISPFPLLLELYKKIRGNTFHPVQLITDLEKHGFDLATTCNAEIVKNFVQYDAYAHTFDTHKIPLLLGAALYEEL